MSWTSLIKTSVLSIAKTEMVSLQFSQGSNHQMGDKLESSTPRPGARSRQIPGQTIVWTLNNKDNLHLHSIEEIVRIFPPV